MLGDEADGLIKLLGLRTPVFHALENAVKFGNHFCGVQDELVSDWIRRSRGRLLSPLPFCELDGGPTLAGTFADNYFVVFFVLGFLQGCRDDCACGQWHTLKFLEGSLKSSLTIRYIAIGFPF